MKLVLQSVRFNVKGYTDRRTPDLLARNPYRLRDAETLRKQAEADAQLEREWRQRAEEKERKRRAIFALAKLLCAPMPKLRRRQMG